MPTADATNVANARRTLDCRRNDRDNHEELRAIANVCAGDRCDLRNVGKRGDGRGNYAVRGYDGGPVPPNQGPYPPGAGGNGSPRIEVFERREFGGRSITLTKNVRRISRTSASTIASCGDCAPRRVALCTDARMQGNCRDFGPGRYNDLGPLGGKVSSAAIVGR